RVKVWAATSKDPAVKAKATAAIAEWESKRARSRGKSAAKAAVNAAELSLSGASARRDDDREEGKKEMSDLFEGIELSEEQQAELARLRQSEIDARQRDREVRVNARIEELKPKFKDSPALLSEIRDLLLSDDGATAVNLSEFNDDM